VSKLNVNAIEPSTGTDITLGASGDTITVPSGATITNSGTATGFGPALTGSTNNQVVTVTGANAIAGETNFIYNGTIVGAGADGANADLGVGLHIKTADSGGSVDSAADELVIEGSAHNGITFLTGTTQTSTINFGDSGDNNIGIVEYNHNTNNMHMYTNAALAMTIDSTGAVIKPLQPAFLCIQTTGISAETVTNATETTIGLNAEIFDIGGDFSASTFTAPVTGKYMLSGRVGVDCGSGTITRLAAMNTVIQTSNRSYYFISNTVYTDENDRGWSEGSVLADMDANDTAVLRVFVSRFGASGTTDTTQTSTTSTVNSPYLSGYLAC